MQSVATLYGLLLCMYPTYSHVLSMICSPLQEGFGDYLETALRATRRSHLKKRKAASNGVEAAPDEDRGASLWQGAFAAGAVAVGAMAALTLRQAFS